MLAHITAWLRILLWLPNVFRAKSKFIPWHTRVTTAIHSLSALCFRYAPLLSGSLNVGRENTLVYISCSLSWNVLLLDLP